MAALVAGTVAVIRVSDASTAASWWEAIGTSGALLVGAFTLRRELIERHDERERHAREEARMSRLAKFEEDRRRDELCPKIILTYHDDRGPGIEFRNDGPTAVEMLTVVAVSWFGGFGGFTFPIGDGATSDRGDVGPLRVGQSETVVIQMTSNFLVAGTLELRATANTEEFLHQLDLRCDVTGHGELP